MWSIRIFEWPNQPTPVVAPLLFRGTDEPLWLPLAIIVFNGDAASSRRRAVVNLDAGGIQADHPIECVCRSPRPLHSLPIGPAQPARIRWPVAMIQPASCRCLPSQAPSSPAIHWVVGALPLPDRLYAGASSRQKLPDRTMPVQSFFQDIDEADLRLEDNFLP